jgi:xanthine dehydrogenase YagR molybdenum-binding subunit
MTHRNAPRMNPPPVFLTAEKAMGPSDLPIMQDDRVAWNGQPVALVLAETQEQANHAISLLRIAYEAEPAATVFAQAKAQSEVATFGGQPLQNVSGDAEAALAASPHAIDVTYRTPRHNHNAIELHGLTVAWDGDRLRLHDATQGVSHTAWTLGQIFGIDETMVHVTSPFVGGAFGAKGLWDHHVLAAAAAKLVRRPVRMALSREGVYRVVGGRALTEQRIAIGASDDGRFVALIHAGVTPKTAHSAFAEPFIFPSQCLYHADTYALEVRMTNMDTLANTFMRAPGEAVGSVALECGIDELADQLGMDPVELRLRNEPDKDPTTGQPFSSRHLVEAYRAGAERFGWHRRHATPSARREGEWLIGMGCATATYPAHRFPGSAARITLHADGRARVGVPAHEMGMGTATTHTMVAADELGLPMDQVTFEYGDSSLPGAVLAGGSQQTGAVGAAIIAARQALIAELLTLTGDGSLLRGLAANEVVCRDAGLCALDDPARYESYATILGRARRDEVTVEAVAAPPEDEANWSMHSYGALFCEVRVSEVTGEVRVDRIVGSFDCGRIINPKTAASQFRGGIVMGLGLALMEETLFDERSGRIVNRNLSDYHVPVHMDVPEIDVMWLDIPDPKAPLGAHGIGEIGITGVGAAVANAVYNATGRRVRDFPLTPDKVLDSA